METNPKIVKGTNHGGRGETQQEQGQREGGGQGGKEFQGDELAAERGNSKSRSFLYRRLALSPAYLLWTPC